MKKISQNDIDYILDNIDIVNLVSEYVKLTKRGKNYIGLCPFHNEKTPSFTVSPDKKISHCFGCGGGGNIFQFLSQIENITYNQAIVKLGSRLGLDLEDSSKKVSYNLDDRTDVMYYANNLIADYYNYILLNTNEAQAALNYLLERGLTLDTIKYFNLGYAPGKNNVAVEFFRSNNVSLDIAVDAGIIGKSTDREEYYDIFKDRVIFPIKDDKSRVVAFSGRTMSEEKTVAKYYNTHETEIFEKRRVLYNLSDARQFINKENDVILCEGYMDVIRSHQEGVKNVVALMGTNIDEYKIQELLNISGKITLALDNDDAGRDATINIGNKILNKTDNVYKLTFSSKKDIDEFLKYKVEKNSDFDFSNYILQNKCHFLEFKMDYFQERTKNNIEQKINAKNEILRNLSYVQDASLRDIILSNLSESFSISRNILLRELTELGINKRREITDNLSISHYSTSIYKQVNYDKKLCTLFKYFFSDRNILLTFYDDLDGCDFGDSRFNKLLDNLIIYYNNYQFFQIHKFINNIVDVEIKTLVTYIDDSNFLVEDNPSEDVIRDYINYFIEKSDQQVTVSTIKDNLKNAIIEADYDTQLTILKQLKKFKK